MRMNHLALRSRASACRGAGLRDRAEEERRIRVSLTRRSALAVPLALAPLAASAQARFPERPLRVVVTFGAGSSPDVVARAWGARLSEILGQPVVIENRAGGATIVGTQAAAQARPDGHTLLVTVNNTFSINPFIYRALPYRTEDFVPVIRILSVPYLLVVPANSPHRALADLIAAAEARPEAMTYGSYGVGQGTHVAMARLLNAAGARMTHVPYREGAMNDLIAGRIDVLVEPTTTAIPFVREGRIHALATMGPMRVDALPQVPAVAETIPGFVGDSWHGVFVNRGTPQAAVDVLQRTLDRIVKEEPFRARLHELGLRPVGGTAEEFRRFLEEDAAAWRKVVQDNDIRAE
jgi:tripartite-type tricarboxylate transporter receptor subunit TctC